MVRVVERIGAAIAVALAASACSPTRPPADPAAEDHGYQLPDNVNYNDHWVPTPAVDLMSSDGTFIRAFAEADELRIFNSNERKGSYPGFVRADRTTNHSAGSGMPASGFAVHWILDVSPQPDGSVTAIVCEISAISPDGPPPNPGILKLTMAYQRVGAAPPADQHGPARAPAASVFGDWYATAYGGPVDEASVLPCLQSKPAFAPSPDTSPGWPKPTT